MLRYDDSYARTAYRVLEEEEVEGSGLERAAMAENSQNVPGAADPRAARKTMTGSHSLNDREDPRRRASLGSVGYRPRRFANTSSLTVRRLRPFLRRRASTLRPLFVFIRRRNPWSRMRFLLLGFL
jgi:hypothetical protein